MNTSISDRINWAAKQAEKIKRDPFARFVGTNYEFCKEMGYKIYPYLIAYNSERKLRIKIVDLELKNGEFILLSIEMMNKVLRDLEKDEKTRIQWILDNNIYGISSEETNIKGLLLLIKEIFKTFDLNYAQLEKHLVVSEDITKDNISKFDINNADLIIGNPPYHGQEHIRYLKLAYNISKRFVVFVQPSSWLIDEKDIRGDYKKIKDLIKLNIREITLFKGGTRGFTSGLFYPYALTVIDKNLNNDGKIKVIDEVNNKEILYNSIDDVNKWGNNQEYLSLKNIILTAANKDNLDNHKILSYGLRSPQNLKKYVVRFAGALGPGIFLPKNRKVETKDEKNTVRGQVLNFSFDTPREANNFFNYLKTKFAIFSLRMYKNNIQINRGELKAVPWLDFSKKWTDESLFLYFKLSPKQQQFIESKILDEEI